MAVERTAEHPGRVLQVSTVTPLMRRIVVSSPTLPGATLLQDVAVVLPDPVEPDRTVRRRYTVRASDVTAGTLALEAVLHGHGPGAAWAAGVAEGDDVVLYGPRAGAEVLTAARVLVLADDAGLPAVLELLPRLDPATATVVVEIADAREQQPVAGVTWLHRDGRPPGEPDALLATATAFGATPADAAYVIAESRVTAAVRDLLLGAGIGRRQLHAKGYWNRDDPRRGGSTP